MRRSLRLIPVALMGALAVAYVLARPALAGRVEHLAIFEFPVGAVVLGLLLWVALRRPAPTPPAPWRQHEQVVRALPDPALASYHGALERWVETGDAPERAAGVIAKATTTDAGEAERIAREIARELSGATTRRQRGSILKKHVRQGA